MERYEFEDQISDYIENNLTLKKRKKFEQYLNENKNAKKLVDAVQYNIKKLNKLPKVSISSDFNQKIINSINDDRLKPKIKKDEEKKTYFGFKPLELGLMFSFIALFSLISYQLFFKKNLYNDSSNYYTKMKERVLENNFIPDTSRSQSQFVKADKDTVIKNKNSYKGDLNKIKLVKYK